MSGTPLFGPGGERLDDEDPKPLPEATQAFIKVEINSGFDRLRGENEAQFRDLRNRVRRPWVWLTILSWILSAVFGLSFYSTWKAIPNRVNQQFIEPKVQQTVSDIIEKRSSSYIDAKIKPLDMAVQDIGARASQLENDITTKQQELQKSQEVIGDQLKIQQLAASAKSGDLDAFEQISSHTTKEGPTQAAATAALREIEIYYDLDAAQLLAKRWVDSVSLQDPGLSVEELLLDFHQTKDASSREAIVNTFPTHAIEESKQLGIVEDLVGLLSTERNLRVRARIVVALNKLTKKSFRPLEVAAV